MNRKRLEHTAGILPDLGMAALVGGVGDAAINPGSGRGSMDAWGIACGIVLLAYSIYLIGIDRRRREA